MGSQKIANRQHRSRVDHGALLYGVLGGIREKHPCGNLHGDAVRVADRDGSVPALRALDNR
jgi:hypothetical protein